MAAPHAAMRLVHRRVTDRPWEGRVTERRIITVEGIVQGVGFRPFVLRTALRLGLVGAVRNAVSGVEIDVEGRAEALDRLVGALGRDHPEPARVDAVTERAASPSGALAMSIDGSGSGGPRSSFSLVGPDLATCPHCLAETFDPDDRRHGYAFHACTECGPRFSVTRRLPFDRASTSMADFDPCLGCSREYAEPSDRRFHAQLIACPECGPSLRYRALSRDSAAWDPEGLGGRGARSASSRSSGTDADALGMAVSALMSGEIVAIKGLGGYHLACDATCSTAVRRLRRRKGRDGKPFAVMVRDLVSAEALAAIDEPEKSLLASPERPIVLCRARDGTPVASNVAPDVSTLGIMLPYAPLHHLLLRGVDRPLVMTSANHSGSPIVYEDHEVDLRLGPVADGFLTHDRSIVIPSDDSVVRWLGGGPQVLRRSRGYAPRALRLGGHPFAQPTLGLGGHLKNTFCLGRGELAMLSPHIGDLESVQGTDAFRKMLAHHRELFAFRPEVVAHDLHPDYWTTRLAQEFEVPAVAVQHHHAHVAACTAEHGVEDPVLGIVFDGAGLGDDGTVWGGEALVVNDDGYRRVGHLSCVPLPGGDAAAREPWRMATAHLWSVYGADMDCWPVNPLPDDSAWPLLRGMLEGGVRSPATSSVGRLFDAVAALLGIRASNRYEGQAAMELEAASDPTAPPRYAICLGDDDVGMVFDARPVIEAIAGDVVRGVAPSTIAGAFHRALADTVVQLALRCREADAVDIVALTGGVFQNRLLTESCRASLEAADFQVLLHRQVPCNDGGLGLGQATIADRVWRREDGANRSSSAPGIHHASSAVPAGMPDRESEEVAPCA